MKIYNKKSFITGIFLLVLGTSNLVMDLINHTFEIKGIVLILALYFMSGGLIIRSLSLKFAKEDRLEKMDEADASGFVFRLGSGTFKSEQTK